MKGITKRFPGVVANKDVDLSIKKGEIHALLGENGAGKTTLMNILYGLYEPDEGEIFLRGEPVRIPDPNKAIELGIGMVHQHFMLVPPFSVAENIVLGTEPTRGLSLDRKEARRATLELSERYGMKVDPDAAIQDISVGMQQRVEILKALHRGAEILIFDEPTAVLTPQEITDLIETMRTLVAQGKTIILITHKLKEVLRIADRVTVIRRGEKIETFETAGADEDALATAMVGRKVTLVVEKGAAKPTQPVLKVEGLEAVNNRRLPAVRGVDFEVKAGEIVGIAGVDGNGQTELVEVITGLRRASAGHVYVGGQEITRWPVAKRIEGGVGHIPEDRQARGLVLDFTVAENLILGNQTRPPFVRSGLLQFGAMENHAERLIEQFDVRPPISSILARSLSGGNQQKVIVAREIDRQPLLLIATQPTRGLDVGAIEFIHKRIVAERDQGKGVLLVSLELDEILALSDRILVMYEGQIVAELDPQEATEERLGRLMAGGGQAPAAGGEG